MSRVGTFMPFRPIMHLRSSNKTRMWLRQSLVGCGQQVCGGARFVQSVREWRSRPLRPSQTSARGLSSLPWHSGGPTLPETSWAALVPGSHLGNGVFRASRMCCSSNVVIFPSVIKNSL